MKRVLVAGLQHESNSFNPIVAGKNDFQVIRGAEVFNRFRDNDPVTGVIKPLMEQGYEVVPTIFTSAVQTVRLTMISTWVIKCRNHPALQKKNRQKKPD